jgi:Ca2+-binding RTX toxin-like protein
MPTRRSLIAAAIALALPATLPALASAATVSADDAGAITLRDAGAETNAVTVTLDAPAQTWVIDDSATPPIAGAGCTQSSAGEVRCAQAAARPTAYLGGGDDTFTAPAEGGWIVYGEAGSDRLAGAAGADTFFGGSGADTLTGAGGNDRLDGGTGDDTIDGGAGEDLVTYTSATGPVTVDLAAGSGGQDGEHDVLTGIEDATASGRLTGDDGPNFLTGGSGDDVITGNGGDDTLVGEAGDDALDGGAGDDRLYGDTTFGDEQGGADRLQGGPGDDSLDGGPGDDWLDGGAGTNRIDCGPGNDTALSGAADSLTDCEGGAPPAPQGDTATPTPTPAQSPAVQPPATHTTVAVRAATVRLRATTLRLGRNGRIALKLNASAAGKVTIVLTRGKVTYLRHAVTLKRGASTVTLKLSASATRTLRKHAKLALKLTIGAAHANVVMKRA